MNPYIIAFGILMPLAIILVGGTSFYRYKKRQPQHAIDTSAEIKEVAKTHLRNQKLGATKLTSTYLLAAPKPANLRKIKGTSVSAFYLYFTYELLAKKLSLEEVVLVTIRQDKKRKTISVQNVSELSAAQQKAQIISRVKKLNTKTR